MSKVTTFIKMSKTEYEEAFRVILIRGITAITCRAFTEANMVVIERPNRMLTTTFE